MPHKSLNTEKEFELSDDESEVSYHSETDDDEGRRNDKVTGDSDEDYVPINLSNDSSSEDDAMNGELKENLEFGGRESVVKSGEGKFGEENQEQLLLQGQDETDFNISRKRRRQSESDSSEDDEGEKQTESDVNKEVLGEIVTNSKSSKKRKEIAKKYEMLPPCACRKLKCFQMITHEQRQVIFHAFWEYEGKR